MRGAGALRDPEVSRYVLNGTRHAQFAVRQLTEQLTISPQVVRLAESVVQNHELMIDTRRILPVGMKEFPKRV